jgi:tRNA A-37 threonylcarbamoyl transferase component Bud32
VSGPDWGRLTRADVDRLTVEVYREAWRARPEVRRIRLLGHDAVVKDYGRASNRFKHLLGAFLATREAAALRRTEEIACVPRFYALPRPWILVMEHIEARRVTALSESERQQALTPAFFGALVRLIDQIHACGVAHGDLEKLDNNLLTPEGAPVIVDFAAAVIAGINPVAALVLPQIEANDFRAVYKLKSLHAPHLLTDEEREKLHARSRAEIIFRRVRTYIRTPMKRWAEGPEDREV